MSRKYFGTDGIRGRVGEHPITAEFMLKLGWATGRVLGTKGGASVIIGKDTRISGYMFESALEAGLAAEPNDIFHSEAVESHHHHRKRRTSSNSESSPLSSDPSGLAVAAAVAAAKRSKPNPGGSGLGHISPPLYHSTAPLLSSGLFPRKDMFGGGTAAIDGRKWSSLYAGKLAIVPGCPSSSNGSGLEAVKPESGSSSTSSSSLPGGPGSGAGGADDEWKNVQVVS